MTPLRAYSGRSLVFAFIGVAASFVGATLYTQYASARIDVAADSISSNAAPSIEHLTAMRGEVGRLLFLLGDYINTRAAGRPANGDAVDAAQARLNAELKTYFQVPAFPGEVAYWGTLQEVAAVLNGGVERVQAQTEAGLFPAARETFDNTVFPAASRLDAVVQPLVDLNARFGAQAAQEIKLVRRRTTVVGLLLDVLCTALAIIAALMVRHEVRRSAAQATERAHLAQERADEFEAFAARVAHDILSPLQAVNLAFEVALRHPDERAVTLEVLERGRRNVRRVRTIIDGLLEFARAGAKPEPGTSASAAEVLTEVQGLFRDEVAHGAIDFVIEPAPNRSVACSRGVLLSLVSNLVQNAIKYVSDSPVRRISTRVTEHGPMVLFEVEDTGPGLPVELPPASVFEPYVRGRGHRQPGLGLGLATVKKLAESHGGRVGVRSELGRGCTFWFELPRASPGLDDLADDRQVPVLPH